MFRVYLDDKALTDLPLDLDGLTESIELDKTRYGIVDDFDVPLVFVGDGFEYIYTQKTLYGYDTKISVRIEIREPKSAYQIEAFFYITDVEFDLKSRKATVDLMDKGWASLIKQYGNNKISPLSPFSKTGVAISAAAPSDVNLYTPSTGVNLATAAKLFNMYGLVNHQIKYLTDNEFNFNTSADVGRVSYDALFYSWVGKHYSMFNRGINPDLFVSHNDTIKQLNVLFNLWWYVNKSVYPWEFTLSHYSEFFDDSDVVYFNNVDSITESFNQDAYFSTVEIGDSHAIIDRGTTYALPYNPMIGFSEEAFNAKSESLIEGVKDLKTDWIIDHNRIEKMLTVTPSAGDYEEDPCLIYSADFLASPKTASKAPYGKRGYSMYNAIYLNANVIKRHDMPSQFQQIFGNRGNNFIGYLATYPTYAATTVDTFLTFAETPYGSDAASNFNNAIADAYWTPATGVYRFCFSFLFKIIDLTSNNPFVPIDTYLGVTLSLIRYNYLGTEVERKTVSRDFSMADANAIQRMVIDEAFFLDKETALNRDYVKAAFTLTMQSLPYRTNSVEVQGAKVINQYSVLGSGQLYNTFRDVYAEPENWLTSDGNSFVMGTCFFSGWEYDGGGIGVRNNPNQMSDVALSDASQATKGVQSVAVSFKNYVSSLLTFDYPIDVATWKSIKEKPNKTFIVTSNGRTYKAYLKSIKRNVKTGMASVTLQTSLINA